MAAEVMELEHSYQSAKELAECQSGGVGGKGESLQPESSVRPVQPARRNLSLMVIYTLLGACILLSVVAIVTTVMLIAGNHQNTLGAFAKLQDEILQLNKSENVQAISHRVLRILKWKDEQPEIVVRVDTNAMAIKYSKQTMSSIAKLQDEISQLSTNSTILIVGVFNNLMSCPHLFAVNFTETDSSITKLLDHILQCSSNLLRCPPGWRRFRESCYHFSSSTETWEEAQRQCVSVDAKLVVINNANEQDFLRRTLMNQHWIGLSDAASEGDWRWVDGTDYSSSSTNWSRGEPNNDKNAEDCVEMLVTGKWNDLPCDERRYWICERPAVIPSSIQQLVPTEQ
ncbi:C-type lectin domain family 17, member A-like [Mobula birostris]|uniref:C-type lectin domain family 17, member A-like n=1 Tax=Mobula birostris TaxID=1983395 RepID=UPI003B28C9FC